MFLAGLSLLHTRSHHPHLQFSILRIITCTTHPLAYFSLVMSESQVQTQVATGPSTEKVVLRYEQVPETTYERMYIRYCLTRNNSKA